MTVRKLIKAKKGYVNTNLYKFLSPKNNTHFTLSEIIKHSKYSKLIIN